MALQFDGSNSTARHYLGLLYLDQREYARAQTQLMEASLYASDDAELLMDLAVAAYYNKDVSTAYAALQGLKALASKPDVPPQTLRGLAIVAAAIGENKQAESYLKEMRQSGALKDETSFVSRRIESWASAHSSGFIKAQFNPSGTSNSGYPLPNNGLPATTGTSSGFNQPGFTQPGLNQSGFSQPSADGQRAFVDKQMVMVDVVIVSTQEDNSNTRGVNLLDGLRIQFGNSSTPAYSRTRVATTDLVNPTASAATNTITRSLGIAAISYTLNIANASEISNDILARPTLIALAGQTSQFFSGVDIVGAAVSGGQGSAVQIQKEVGVRLAVTPDFLPNNSMRLQVVAERTFLTNPSTSVVFDFRLDTTKTTVNANMVMKFGETLILSGLTERDTGVTASSVPLLRDIPLVQYLFSNSSKRDFQKSVLIMVTPRRPQYTNRDQADIDADSAKLSEHDRVQQEFEDKYRLWYKLIPNIAFTATQLNDSALYREFRSGDLEVTSWVSRKSHSGRLRSALDFLFY